MPMRKERMKKSCFLHSIYFHDKNLYIQVKFPIKKETPSSLLFVERYTTKKRVFPLSIKNENTLLTLLTPDDLEKLLIEGKDWDVFVTFINHEERIRLSSNLNELEMLYFLKDDKMLAPFTTNNGNVSFKSQIPSVITKVNHVDIMNKDNIVIHGYLVNPLWSKLPSNLKGSLVVSTKENDYVTKVPLIGLSTGHRNDQPHLMEFKAVISINTLLLNKTESPLKTRIELSYDEGFRRQTVETPPFKLKSPTFKSISIIKKTNGKKNYISIYRTKKARQLSIQLYDFNFKKHIKSKVKEKLLFLKRHSMVKQIYKKSFHWIGRLPSDKKIIIFESFLGKQYSDNPRAIYEYLKEHHYPYKFYWSVDRKFKHNFHDKGLNCIHRFSLRWLLIMPRARYWVTNSRMPLWLPKPKDTIYLQTWHGTPLKKLAADMDEVYMPGTTAEVYKKNFIKEAKNWDYLISPNAYSTEIFRRAFQFEKTVLETGYPRNDFICNHNNKETIKKLATKYGLPLDKRIILYAPTWRDDQFYSKGNYRFNVQLDLELMKEQLGEDYVILFRLHYLISENLDVTAYSGFAYDFSNHEDIRELYVMADILITDYSSVFFDYGNLKRPMIFYVYDIDQYRDHLRGFYFDFEQEAPGPLVKTTEEVIQTIKNIKTDSFHLSNKFDSFYKRFCYLECGDSTRKVVEKIFD